MDERALPRRHLLLLRLPLLISLILLNSCTQGTSDDGNALQLLWNLIGVIKTIRHGQVDQDDEPADLLKDPQFIYSTLYRFVDWLDDANNS